jgi:thiamine pyrophosphate-dependent acetolactate synthase large subunit-like protein
MNDRFPAEVAVLGAAKSSCEAIAAALGDVSPRVGTAAEVAAIKQQFRTHLSASEVRHCMVLELLRETLPADTIVMADVCQLVYTGAFAFDVSAPRSWNYPGGYCTLGSALPDAIGARLARPNTPVVAFAGDGGFMFTVQELVTGAELGLALPIILWNNDGLKQIQDDMKLRDIELVGVSGINPDFMALAQACHCHAVRAETAAALRSAIHNALAADRPTLIEVGEQDAWLN